MEISRVSLHRKKWYSEVCEFYDLPITDVLTSAIDASYYRKYPRIRRKRLEAIDRLCARVQPSGSPTLTDVEKSLSWKTHFMSCVWSERSGHRRINLLTKLVRCAGAIKSDGLMGQHQGRMRVLDFGCGTSLFGRLMVEAHPDAELILCDIDGFHFRFASHRTRLFSTLALPYPIDNPLLNCPDFGPLDFVYCYTVFEHLPNTSEVIRHLSTSLRAGGIFVETYTGHSRAKPHKSDTESSYATRDANLDYLRQELILVCGALPGRDPDHAYSESGGFRIWMKPPANEHLQESIRRIILAPPARSLPAKIGSRYERVVETLWAYSRLL